MRILQAMAGAEFGGAEAFFMRLVIALHKVGLEQRVIIRNHPTRAQILREAGIEPIELAFGGWADFRTPSALKREIRAFRPDVALTWMNRASRMLPDGDFVHVARLGGYYKLKYYRKCDHLVGNTEDIRDYLIGDGWPAERAHYLPNFVAGTKAEPVDRRQFFTPDGAPLVVAMGRLHENKAFDVLLEAMARIPSAYLWIAGEGPLRAELEKKAEVLGVKPRTRFLGWREDTPALLASADVFVCPSRHEPLGNVVLEAWAQRVAVVAADSYGPGTLIENRETGLLVPVDDAKAMSVAILELLEDDKLRRTVARQGHRVYKRDFTEKVIVARYLEFFESVAGNAS
jgi:glycosyltransferase involved in cell wall biosynthesis